MFHFYNTDLEQNLRHITYFLESNLIPMKTTMASTPRAARIIPSYNTACSRVQAYISMVNGVRMLTKTKTEIILFKSQSLLLKVDTEALIMLWTHLRICIPFNNNTGLHKQKFLHMFSTFFKNSHRRRYLSILEKEEWRARERNIHQLTS